MSVRLDAEMTIFDSDVKASKLWVPSFARRASAFVETMKDLSEDNSVTGFWGPKFNQAYVSEIRSSDL